MSEVARLRKQIEMECEAMRRMTNGGYATVSKHAIIAHSHNRLGAVQDQLADLVGEGEALKMVADIYIETLG